MPDPLEKYCTGENTFAVGRLTMQSYGHEDHLTHSSGNIEDGVYRTATLSRAAFLAYAQGFEGRPFSTTGDSAHNYDYWVVGYIDRAQPVGEELALPETNPVGMDVYAYANEVCRLYRLGKLTGTLDLNDVWELTRLGGLNLLARVIRQGARPEDGARVFFQKLAVTLDFPPDRDESEDLSVWEQMG